MRRRRPLPRSAPHAPSDTKSSRTSPPRLAHVGLAIRSRAFPVEPPKVPVLAARAHRNHELLLRHQSCRRVSSPSASWRPQDRLEPPVDGDGNPRAVDALPAATVAHRIAARYASRQIQRREYRPHPRAAAGPPTATRPRTARPSPPPGSRSLFNRRRHRPRVRPRRRAAPGTPPPGTAPAARSAACARPPVCSGCRCSLAAAACPPHALGLTRCADPRS